MAGVFPFSALDQRMDKLGGRIGRGVTKLAQDVAKGIGATLVDTTPVDTGLARSNWRATLNGPASGVIPPYSPGNHLGISESSNATGAKSQQKQAIERFDASKGLGSIFITNNVGYIGKLDAGSSNQNPAGMVNLAISTGRAILQARAGKVLDRK